PLPDHDHGLAVPAGLHPERAAPSAGADRTAGRACFGSARRWPGEAPVRRTRGTGGAASARGCDATDHGGAVRHQPGLAVPVPLCCPAASEGLLRVGRRWLRRVHRGAAEGAGGVHPGWAEAMNRFPPDRHEHDPRGSCRGWRTSRLRRAAPIVVILIASSFHPGRLTAQEARDLASLRDAAVRSDPRTSRLALLEEATNLRLANLAAEWLPSLNLGATASYQSEVPAVPIDRPDLEIPVPPMQRYESAIEAEQLIYDGGVLRGRRAIEEARLHTEQARIQAELYPLRSEVNEAFFRALLLQETID